MTNIDPQPLLSVLEPIFFGDTSPKPHQLICAAHGVQAVFENLASQQPKDNFTVGITDDVTFSSLPHGAEPEVLPEGTTECIFW